MKDVCGRGWGNKEAGMKRFKIVDYEKRDLKTIGSKRREKKTHKKDLQPREKIVINNFYILM